MYLEGPSLLHISAWANAPPASRPQGTAPVDGLGAVVVGDMGLLLYPSEALAPQPHTARLRTTKKLQLEKAGLLLKRPVTSSRVILALYSVNRILGCFGCTDAVGGRHGLRTLLSQREIGGAVWHRNG